MSNQAARDLRWWEGKTEQEIQEHYENAERDMYRARESFADGRSDGEETFGNFDTLIVTCGLSEDDTEEARAKVDAFFSRLAEWKKANKVRGKIEDTLQGMMHLADDHPSFVDLGEVLGVHRMSAKERFDLIERYRPVFAEIAREVGLGE